MYPELAGNPLAMEQYKVTDSTTTGKTAGLTIQMLITQQLGRIDFLKTIPMATKGMSEIAIIRSIKLGLRSIESKLHPFLEKEYYKQTDPIKSQFNKEGLSVIQELDLLAQWEDTLIDNLGKIDLLPQGSKDLEID